MSASVGSTKASYSAMHTAPGPMWGSTTTSCSLATVRRSSRGIEGCTGVPICSAMSSSIGALRQGTARSTSTPSIVTTVVPRASRAASTITRSVSSIMSW